MEMCMTTVSTSMLMDLEQQLHLDPFYSNSFHSAQALMSFQIQLNQTFFSTDCQDQASQI